MARIVYEKDTDMVVHINRENQNAPVRFEYAAFDEAPMQSTPYRTADMPADDQAAAEIINSYAANMAA